MAEQHGRPVDCTHSGYSGPERRTRERREQCLAHAGMEKGYDDIKDLQQQACKKIDKLTASVDTKVPMKLFYVMIGLVIAILAFQWTTYERVNLIALDHQKTAGDMKVELQKIVSTSEGNRIVNTNEIGRLTRSVDRHQLQADKEIGDIKSDIKEVKKDIQVIRNRQLEQHPSK